MAILPISTLEADILDGFGAETAEIQAEERRDLEYQRLLETLEFERARRPQQLRNAETRNDLLDESLSGAQRSNRIGASAEAGTIIGNEIVETTNRARQKAGLGQLMADAEVAQQKFTRSNSETGVKNNEDIERFRAARNAVTEIQIEVDRLNAQLRKDVAPQERQRLENELAAKISQQRNAKITADEMEKYIPQIVRAQGDTARAASATANNTIANAPAQRARDKAVLEAQEDEAIRELREAPDRAKLRIAQRTAQLGQIEGGKKLNDDIDSLTAMEQIYNDPGRFHRWREQNHPQVTSNEQITKLRQAMKQNMDSAGKNIGRRMIQYGVGSAGSVAAAKAFSSGGSPSSEGALIGGGGNLGTGEGQTDPNAAFYIQSAATETAQQQPAEPGAIQRLWNGLTGTRDTGQNGSGTGTRTTSRPVQRNFGIDGGSSAAAASAANSLADEGSTSPEIAAQLGEAASIDTRTERQIAGVQSFEAASTMLRTWAGPKKFSNDKTATERNRPIRSQFTIDAAVRDRVRQGMTKDKAKAAVRALVDIARKTDKRIPYPR